MKKRAGIIGIDSYFPNRVMTNADFEKILETSDAWIVERTGIRQRHIAPANETAASMGVAAAKTLLGRLNKKPEDIDLILVSTVTPDHLFPATACLIQDQLGAKNCFGFDLAAACSGYLFGLETARAYLESGRVKNVLLISSEKMSSIVDFQDRNTCILFGDGAAATWLELVDGDRGIIDSISRIDGSGVPYLLMPAGGCKMPITEELLKARKNFAYQEGKQVFKRAVVDMAEISAEILEKNKVKAEELTVFVPHQANLRIIDAAVNRIGLSPDKVAMNIDRRGNTTSATIPTALDEWIKQGKAKPGDLVLFAAFGAGFTWGSTLLRL